MSKKIYFDKTQNTSDKTITKFYYNKLDKNYNNLDFLKSKIKTLIKSPKSTDGIKKQLRRIENFDFSQYDIFYIYSNKLCFGIKIADKTIDFYDGDYDTVIKLAGYEKKYNVKLPKTKSDDENTADDDATIDASDLVAPADDTDDENGDE